MGKKKKSSGKKSSGPAPKKTLQVPARYAEKVNYRGYDPNGSYDDVQQDYAGRKSSTESPPPVDKPKEKKIPNVDNRLYYESGSAEEAAYIQSLEDMTHRIDTDFVSYVKNTDLKSLEEKEPTMLDTMNMMYHRRMMLACTEPLMHGVSSDSIVQAIGMFTGMCLLSKDFREDMSVSVGNVLYPYVQKKAEAAPEDSAWGRARDAVLKMQNHGRLPLTPKSAALMNVGFLERAYVDMRRPGADVNKILGQYEEAISVLRTQAEHDGVSSEDLAENMRTIIGQMCVKNPDYSRFCNELSHGAVRRCPFQTVMDNGEMKDVWKGEYEFVDGTPYTEAFTPRPPESYSAHAGHLHDMFRNADAKGMSVADMRMSEEFTGEYWRNYRMMEEDGLSEDMRKNASGEACFMWIDGKIRERYPDSADTMSKAFADWWMKQKASGMDESRFWQWSDMGSGSGPTVRREHPERGTEFDERIPGVKDMDGPSYDAESDVYDI